MRRDNGNLVADFDGILTGRDDDVTVAVDAGYQQIVFFIQSEKRGSGNRRILGNFEFECFYAVVGKVSMLLLRDSFLART